MGTESLELSAGKFRRLPIDGVNDQRVNGGAEGTANPENEREYTAATPSTESSAESTFDGQEPQKRRRGRPPKSGSETGSARTTTRKSSKNLSLISADHIEGVHRIAALYTGIPVLSLEREEAEKISDAIQRVMNEYDLGEINPKLAAWLNLLGVLSLVYGMKVYAFKVWKSQIIAEASAAENASEFFGTELNASTTS